MPAALRVAFEQSIGIVERVGRPGQDQFTCDLNPASAHIMLPLSL